MKRRWKGTIGRRGTKGRALLRISVVVSIFFLLVHAPIFSTALTGEREAAAAGGRDVADWTILGLDARDYASRISPRVQLSERRWVRHHKVLVVWAKAEPRQDVFNWSYFDQEINARLADGTDSLMLLLTGATPAWARDPAYGSQADKAPPLDLRWWYDFCSAVAERYGSVVDFYEVWNEPGWDRDSSAYRNYGIYHFGGQVETDYLPMLQTAYQAIKEKDPTALVVSGDMQCSNNPSPDVGTELYRLLFDEVNRPGQDVSVRVEAEQPVVAERPMYFNYAGAWAGGHDSLGATSPATEWYFAEGCTRPGFHTYLCLQNPGDEQATVAIDYLCGDREVITRTVSVGPRSRKTVAVHGDEEGIGVHNTARGDVSIKVRSTVPVVAERPMYFDYAGGKRGGHVTAGALSPRSEWYFAEGCHGFSLEEYLCLQNPHESAVQVTLHFMMSRGQTLRRTLTLAPRSRTTLCLNYAIGFRGSCDMANVHPYKNPPDWGSYYANVVRVLRSLGVGHEVVVSEAGWPHYSDEHPQAFDEQKQAEAIGPVGVNSLLKNGCRKIWIYQMMDEDPGTSWDSNYFGLFRYDGTPCKAWAMYKEWQRTLFPDYPDLPPSLP